MANVKISALSTIPGNAVSGNDLFLLTQTANAISRSLSVSNARIAISDANDYITYSIFVGAHSGANTRLAGTESNVIALQAGISNTNAALSDNVVIFSGAFTGSNTRISGTESNVISLQLSVSGANTAILNLQSGLSGANTYGLSYGSNIANLQVGLSGTNTTIAAITNSPVTFQSDVLIRGNLTLTGNTTIVSANTISFGDSLLSLAANNTVSDNLDIGLYGHYWNGSANSHTGIFRSAVSKDWMVFSNYTIDLEGNSIVTISNSSFTLGNLRIRTANASQDIYAANAIISPLIYSNGVELRANDYVTYLATKGGIDGTNTNLSGNVAIFAGAFSGSNTNIINLIVGLDGSNTDIVNLTSGLIGSNTSILNLQSGISGTNTNLSGNVAIFRGAFSGSNTRLSGTESNVIALQGGFSGANTNILNLIVGLLGSNTDITDLQSAISGASVSIVNLQTGLSGTNSTVATKDSIANVYSTYLAATSNDFVTYTRLYANVNSVQSNLTAYAAYANSTFSTSNNTPASVTYIVSSYTTSAVNSYPIGTVVSSVNNVSVHLNGVYQNKNQYILSNSSANIQFTDASLASSLSLEIVTIR